MAKSIEIIQRELCEISGNILALATVIDFQAADTQLALRQLSVRLDLLLPQINSHRSLAHVSKWSSPRGSSSRWIKDQKEKNAGLAEQTALHLKKYILALLVMEPKETMEKGKEFIDLGQDIDELIGEIKSGHVEIPSSPKVSIREQTLEPHTFQATFAVIATFVALSKWILSKRKASSEKSLTA